MEFSRLLRDGSIFGKPMNARDKNLRIFIEAHSACYSVEYSYENITK